MLNFIVFIPLAVSGLVTALYREHKRHLLSETTAISIGSDHHDLPTVIVDDVVELTHYQYTSLTGLALSASLSLFYSPLLVVTIPLLTYNTFYLLKSIQKTTQESQFIPAINIFEVLNIMLNLLTRHYVWSSLLLLVSFYLRVLRLKILNTTYRGRDVFNNPVYTVWVLRDQIEVATPLNELHKHDILAIYEGEIIPVAGMVVKGEATVQQYSVTGRMQTVTKHVNQVVFAFTRVETGKIYIRYS